MCCNSSKLSLSSGKTNCLKSRQPTPIFLKSCIRKTVGLEENCEVENLSLYYHEQEIKNKCISGPQVSKDPSSHLDFSSGDNFCINKRKTRRTVPQYKLGNFGCLILIVAGAYTFAILPICTKKSHSCSSFPPSYYLWSLLIMRQLCSLR